MSVPASYKLLNGVSIPSIGFGTFATNPCSDLVYNALNVGYRLLDSAVMYHNEAEVCEGLAKWVDEGNDRSSVVYTTKLLDSQQGYDNAKRAIAECLVKAKKIDYIDLLLLHSPQTDKTHRLGAWKAMQEAVDSGKVKNIGVSNFGSHHLQELLSWDGLKYKPVVNQCELSPWLQRNDIAEFCKKQNIQMEAYSPLTQGQMLNEPGLVKIAKKYNKTPAQVLIRWSMQKGYLPIPRSSNVDRLKGNFEATQFELEQEDFESLGDPKAYKVFDWDPTTYRG